MKANYSRLLSFDRTLYDIHLPEYNPLKEIEAFWKHYPIGQIRDNIIALESKVNSDALSEFSIDLLRTLAAYLTAHVSNLDLTSLSLSEVFETSKEELSATKEIFDFFQRVSQSNTNS